MIRLKQAQKSVYIVIAKMKRQMISKEITMSMVKSNMNIMRIILTMIKKLKKIRKQRKKKGGRGGI